MATAVDTCSLVMIAKNYLPLDKDGQLYSSLKKTFSHRGLMLFGMILDESERAPKRIAIEKTPLLKNKRLIIPAKDLFPCAPEEFSNMIDSNFCVRLKKQELTEEEYIEQREEYLKAGDTKIITYILSVRRSGAIHLEKMQVMTEETRQQDDDELFKKLPLLCEQIGIGILTASEYLCRNGLFIDEQHRYQYHLMTSFTRSYYVREQDIYFSRIRIVEGQIFNTLLQCGKGDVNDKG